MALVDEFNDRSWRSRRAKQLSQLLGIKEAEAGDEGVAGRLAIIAKLKAARRAEIKRGQANSWIYDVNRHLNLCAALRAEYEDLSEHLTQGAEEERPTEGCPALRLDDLGSSVKGLNR